MDAKSIDLEAKNAFYNPTRSIIKNAMKFNHYWIRDKAINKIQLVIVAHSAIKLRTGST